MAKFTVCSYCGVGCRFVFEKGKLTPTDSACSKGLSLVETIDINRLTKPLIRDNIKDDFKVSTYDKIIKLIAKKIKQTTAKKIGFYLSGQMLNEDYYVANKLAKGFIGTPNCDTNSRTCMASAVVGYKKSFGIDYVPVCSDDIDKANLLILIGSNVASSHVVLFNKIKKAKKNGLKVVLIDPRETKTAKIADIFIQIDANKDIDLLNALAIKLIQNNQIDNDFIKNYTNNFDSYKTDILKLDIKQLIKNSNISYKLFEKFYQLFINSNNIITAWTMGINQSSQGVDKNLAINNLHLITGKINKDGNGPFSLTGQPNAMGGREVGGLSTTLAVHLDYNEENCKKVSTFWNSSKLPTSNGLTAFEMIQEADKKNIDILFVCHTDPIYHLPNRNFTQNAFKKIPLVVEINSYNNSLTSNFSHICLPAKPFGEKSGTQTNLDKIVSIVEANYLTKDILQEWEIFAKIGQELGFVEEFGYKNSVEVFKEYQEMTKLSTNRHLDIFKIDINNLKNSPYQWGKNLFKNNQFLTPNKKANLFFISNNNLSQQPNNNYPLILLTGRIKDQWHTGSKTKYVEKLLKTEPLEFVEINKLDSIKYKLKENDEVIISSIRGKITAKVKITNIKQGHIFIPISHLGVNFLTNDILDKESFQPDYNHSAVSIKKQDKF